MAIEPCGGFDDSTADDAERARGGVECAASGSPEHARDCSYRGPSYVIFACRDVGAGVGGFAPSTEGLVGRAHNLLPGD